jgi:hypothetical protein
MITSITRKPGKVFLSTLILAGIIAISSHSFMIGAYAQEVYGMYNNKDPIVDVEKLKCNNYNFNIDEANPQVLSLLSNKIHSILAEDGAADNSEKYSLDENIVLICTNGNNPVS